MVEVKRVRQTGWSVCVYNVLDPEKPLAEDWAVLETYLGAFMFLEPIAEWKKTIKAISAKVVRAARAESCPSLYKSAFLRRSRAQSPEKWLADGEAIALTARVRDIKIRLTNYI